MSPYCDPEPWFLYFGVFYAVVWSIKTRFFWIPGMRLHRPIHRCCWLLGANIAIWYRLDPKVRQNSGFIPNSRFRNQRSPVVDLVKSQFSAWCHFCLVVAISVYNGSQQHDPTREGPPGAMQSSFHSNFSVSEWKNIQLKIRTKLNIKSSGTSSVLLYAADECSVARLDPTEPTLKPSWSFPIAIRWN